jgi:hypothetical protein
MITTGQEPGLELVGEFGKFISERDPAYDEDGFSWSRSST